jgi:hypothetical protein
MCEEAYNPGQPTNCDTSVMFDVSPNNDRLICKNRFSIVAAHRGKGIENSQFKDEYVSAKEHRPTYQQQSPHRVTNHRRAECKGQIVRAGDGMADVPGQKGLPAVHCRGGHVGCREYKAVGRIVQQVCADGGDVEGGRRGVSKAPSRDRVAAWIGSGDSVDEVEVGGGAEGGDDEYCVGWPGRVGIGEGRGVCVRACVHI